MFEHIAKRFNANARRKHFLNRIVNHLEKCERRQALNVLDKGVRGRYYTGLPRAERPLILLCVWLVDMGKPEKALVLIKRMIEES